MPTVINRHHYKGKPLPEPHFYIGRGTALGNTVSTKAQHGPEEALRRYRLWLLMLIEERDSSVMGALGKIGPNTHLVCSCAPAPCHGDVVLEVWEWLAGKGEW